MKILEDNKTNERLLAAIEKLKEVIENLFILEASRARIPKDEIRKILGIDKNRIGRISKHIKG
jgi:hypothetical protein